MLAIEAIHCASFLCSAAGTLLLFTLTTIEKWLESIVNLKGQKYDNDLKTAKNLRSAEAFRQAIFSL